MANTGNDVWDLILRLPSGKGSKDAVAQREKAIDYRIEQLNHMESSFLIAMENYKKKKEAANSPDTPSTPNHSSSNHSSRSSHGNKKNYVGSSSSSGSSNSSGDTGMNETLEW